MPRKPKKEQVSGQYFRWLVGTRNGVYYGDGRSNNPPLGRHSLATRDRAEALEHLRRLDLTKAIELGRADPALLQQDQESLLSLEEGQKRYLAFVSRPPVQGGGSPGTVKRYRTILAKFLGFAKEKGLLFWQQVNKDVLMRYGAWLEHEDYHDKTQYTELTVVKQVVKWMVGEKLLSATNLITLKLKKPEGTATYAYSQAQVRAIVAYCRGLEGLGWLADVVTALATTGLRIGELSNLRWGDVDVRRGLLHLKDTTRRGRRSKRHEARTTKSHKDRTLPLHDELRAVLVRLPRLPDGRVFHGPKQGKLKADTVRVVLKRDVLPALAGQFPADGDDPGITAGRVHSFRHYFVSMSADSGVPETTLKSWLGHRDSGLIQLYYHNKAEEGRKQLLSSIPFLGASSEKPAATENGEL